MDILLALIKTKKGIIIAYVLAFGTIFLILLSGLLMLITSQQKFASQRAAFAEALNIAEAGINYYRWCINNDAESVCLNTPEHTYSPFGVPIGKFSLQVTSTESCGQEIKKEIISTGWTDKFPQSKRKVGVLYARTSVAKYSYILNSNVWIGDDHQIRGPYHSNGGIRMDGANQSTMTSVQNEWICTSTFGCSPCPTSRGCYTSGSNCICPGVFTTTTNANEGLFNFPVPPFDFNGITIDLAQMKSVARDEDSNPGDPGIYLPPSNTIDSNGKGYHIIFKDNDTMEVRIITALSKTTYGGCSNNCAYSLEEDWHNDFFTITSENVPGTIYNIPSACSAIFIEDNIWPEGIIKGKISIASANLITPGVDTDVVLLGNIDYATTDDSDGLVLIGENRILIGPQSPNNMILRGIFIAQKGRFGRNCYPGNSRNSLQIFGSVISNGRVGTQWSGGSCDGSGYANRESYFDSNLIYDPPSFVPYIEPDFKILDWKETK